MPGVLTTGFVVLVAVGAALLYPTVERLGAFRTVQPTGSRDCITVPELQSCEDIALDHSTGLLYAACSTVRDRINWLHWLPEIQDRKQYEYLATYDASSRTVKRLDIAPGGKFDATRSASLHGLDVVPSAANPKELFLYVINHRIPATIDEFVKNGTDDVIEVFKTRAGSATLEHLHTFSDPSTMIGANGISGSPDGKSLYFTNSEGKKMSWRDTLQRTLEMFRASTSVVYCHVDKGCSFVASGLHGVNGIVRAPSNNTLYVASSTHALILVHEVSEDGTIVPTETIPMGLPVDNLAMDKDGVIWAAAFPKAITLATCMQDYTFQCRVPATALSVSKGKAPAPYTVERVFEDNGTITSGVTAVVHDAERKRLYMSGAMQQWLTVCNV
ncbi:calcium-dependent phosphotriesterase [Exidia glandulosa HHB12029]|uniref:Calcium-dependent phosphotriesterase n=1 Tax=Exidia glandulosa HHB12029 TaxID=1314781 RepID=A0A165HEW0_EXIGL|nr:calcium-dependent phosphotriesterase [Exidia glandulosa HHB12029]